MPHICLKFGTLNLMICCENKPVRATARIGPKIKKIWCVAWRQRSYVRQCVFRCTDTHICLNKISLTREHKPLFEKIINICTRYVRCLNNEKSWNYENKIWKSEKNVNILKKKTEILKKSEKYRRFWLKNLKISKNLEIFQKIYQNRKSNFFFTKSKFQFFGGSRKNVFQDFEENCFGHSFVCKSHFCDFVTFRPHSAPQMTFILPSYDPKWNFCHIKKKMFGFLFSKCFEIFSTFLRFRFRFFYLDFQISDPRSWICSRILRFPSDFQISKHFFGISFEIIRSICMQCFDFC